VANRPSANPRGPEIEHGLDHLLEHLPLHAVVVVAQEQRLQVGIAVEQTAIDQGRRIADPLGHRFETLFDQVGRRVHGSPLQSSSVRALGCAK